MLRHLHFLSFFILSSFGAPLTNDTVISTTTDSSYNLENFDEVYDRRQNGTENYQVNLDGVILVWAPPQSLFTVATLIDPALFESIISNETPSLEEVKPEEKPVEVKPEEKPVEVSTEKEVTIQIKQAENGGNKRRFRLPGFLRPFVQNRRVGQAE